MLQKLLLTTSLAVLCSATAASATVTWTDWNPNVYTVSSGSGGSATGTLGGVSVTYSGEMEFVDGVWSHWGPSSTWTGGDVNVAPPVDVSPCCSDSGIELWGGTSVTDTLTFSSPVYDPVIAIVSLGQALPGQAPITASYDFAAGETFSLLGGGPSNAYGGSALTSVGQDVFGTEGNGLVQFKGTYSSLSWTVPTYEYYNAFTVGSAVPEASTWVMMLLGFVGLGVVGSLRSRKPALFAA